MLQIVNIYSSKYSSCLQNTHTHRQATMVTEMAMEKISSEIIKECRGKHRLLCSFSVTISILRISYKNSNLGNMLLLSEDAVFHARWTFFVYQ